MTELAIFWKLTEKLIKWALLYKKFNFIKKTIIIKLKIEKEARIRCISHLLISDSNNEVAIKIESGYLFYEHQSL